MNTCSRCAVEKDLSQFYVLPTTTCKECVDKERAAWRAQFLPTPKERKKRIRPPYTPRARKQRNMAPAVTAHGRYKQRNHEKTLAHKRLGYAVRVGHIIKPDTCQHCGTGGRIHGHHHDYSKALEVMWLCPPCHGLEHSKYDMEVINENQALR